jgi:hypothetical protein
MPQPQKFYKSDPDKKGRGAGFYYARTVPKGNRRVHVHSKYSGSKDGNYKYPNAVGQPKLKAKYDHAGDRTHKKKTHHSVSVTPRKTKKFLGWF